MTVIKGLILYGSVPLLIAGSAALAAEQSAYGGKMSVTVVQQEMRPIDAAGHVIIAEVSKAKNVSTGRIAWMDGAEVVLSEVVDLDKGAGIAHGSGAHVKDGASMPFSYVSNIKTVMMDGKPVMTTEGTTTPLAKSPIRNVRQKCVFTSQTTAECEWWGDAARGPRSSSR